MNSIKTWQQGEYIDEFPYLNMSKWKAKKQKEEELLVRPGPTEDAICKCKHPKDAKWIASRLNLASVLEEMSYNFATEKSDGSELINFVNKMISFTNKKLTKENKWNLNIITPK